MSQALQDDIKTAFSSSLLMTYSWFYNAFLPKIEQSCKEFFGLDLGLKLFSIGENTNILFKGEEYFVTQIKLNKYYSVALRLSKTAIENILDEVLGRRDKVFQMEDLDELEVKIITTFNDFVYSRIKSIFPDEKALPKGEKTGNDCHLVFYMHAGEKDFGKFVLTIPTKIISPTPIKSEKEIFDIEDFKKSPTQVRVKVGTSKIRLSDVKELDVEDILVLDESNIYHMKLDLDGREIDFKINPDPSIILDTDNDGGEAMSESTSLTANIWDNITVEIGAEFEKVKITLGELKQISQGLVVDIGSIYENRVELKVENKIVAKGELVIINDRYGVKIDEVIAPDKTQDDQIAQTQVDDEDFETEDTEEPGETAFEEDDFSFDEEEDLAEDEYEEDEEL